MNREFELKLQSYVDGELSSGESRQVTALVDADQDARALLAELEMTRNVLVANEPEMKVPESREFYWSKIQREINRTGEAPVEARKSLVLSWRKIFAPLAGVAFVALLAVGTVTIYDLTSRNNPARHLAEIENLSEDTGSYSFRSQSENMFVVWVYDKNQESPQSEVDADSVAQ